MCVCACVCIVGVGVGGKCCGAAAAAVGRELKRPDCSGEWCRVQSLLLQNHDARGEGATKCFLMKKFMLFHIVTVINKSV